MSHTTSLSFPNMFDVARNVVATKSDEASIVNRTRLLILTDPTSLYNSPTFGVGLKKYLWQYNTENVKAMIQDRIKEQLKEHEPCVDADATIFVDGLVFTEAHSELQDMLDINRIKMTVGLVSVYGSKLSIDLNS